MAQTRDPAADVRAHRDALRRARRVVIKVGSSILTDPGTGVDQDRIRALAAEAAALRQEGRQVVLVSSGAVAAGAARLGMRERPTALPVLQASAAVGQGKLMRYYAEAFAAHEIPVGQVLLTRDVLDNRTQYLNARNTLAALLELGVVAIVNENDTVVVEEIQFGDNDQLSSLVAIMADADALVLLSDIDGLHEKPPAEGPSPVVEYVPAITAEVEALAGVSQSRFSRGGMASKLSAVARATAAGIPVALADGSEPGVVGKLCAGEPRGTCFGASASSAPAKKQWLAGRQATGAIVVDAGARRAVVERGKSLLPIGMLSAEAAIRVGDTVSIRDESGAEFARGISNYDGADLQRIARKRSEDLASILGDAYAPTVVHRDNLLVTRPRADAGPSPSNE
jgi:glutamate 5-kinase